MQLMSHQKISIQLFPQHNNSQFFNLHPQHPTHTKKYRRKIEFIPRQYHEIPDNDATHLNHYPVCSYYYQDYNHVIIITANAKIYPQKSIDVHLTITIVGPVTGQAQNHCQFIKVPTYEIWKHAFYNELGHLNQVISD